MSSPKQLDGIRLNFDLCAYAKVVSKCIFFCIGDILSLHASSMKLRPVFIL